MLCEIECRALNVAHPMLIQDFEPRDALTYLEALMIFSEDHTDQIKAMTTRCGRIAEFLRSYRRQASELAPLIEFFKYNHQTHLSDFFENYIEEAIHHPELLDSRLISMFERQKLDRKLLSGNVPRQMDAFCRDYHVKQEIGKLEALGNLIYSFFLFLHGRAGSGKSVIASQALSRSDHLFAVSYDSVVWLKDIGTTAKPTFDLFTDLLLMLKRASVVHDTDDSNTITEFINCVLSRSEDNLLNFSSVERLTSFVLKRMIVNALIDRPNTLFVFDDVVQEETIRWAQELRLRCLVTTRDVEICNVASSTCEFVEVTSLEDDECYDLLEAFRMPMPTGEREEDILRNTIKLTSGSPVALMMVFKSCEPKTFDKMAQLNYKMETRGLSGIECMTTYCFKFLSTALQRCVEVLSDEDRNALALSVIMPPGIDIPIKIWSCIIPVDLCSNEEEHLDDEVADRLKRQRGAFLSGKRLPVLTFKIDHIIHLFLKHVVDAQTIRNGLSTLEQRLREINNNVASPVRNLPLQKYRRTSSSDMYPNMDEPVIRPEKYHKFMKIHSKFYDSLKKDIPF
ncbi:hypothetical protein CAEBREN_13342 [Caenorhabditis brenneri]|uniref:CARD domain-containing protein n=1 Tax=Caenorhabditis brenneri TaxID=135651 RepID=G0MG23_CAEBE|nr:hypothetical protein CAEBREN_13342 [Caenorhabditis brenneri]